MTTPDWNKLRQDGEELPDPFGPDAQPIEQVGDGGTSGLGSLWPAPLGEAAYHGLAGEFVRAVEPHSEADPAALLVQFLAAFGSVVGRGPHFLIDGSEHHANLFAVLGGATSSGRKGTSWGHVRRTFEQVDAVWAKERLVNGLSSGEGLTHAVRDERCDSSGKVLDPGVRDKRLLAFESELAVPLRQFERKGNTLSATLRSAWDGSVLGSLTKNEPSRAATHHVSLIAHVTHEELRCLFKATDAANGVANRFLWVCSKRSKHLPLGGNVSSLSDLVATLRERVGRARHLGRVPFNREAEGLWVSAYECLSADRPGLAGKVTARGPAQVLRLALIYALLDGATVIERPHLAAALEVWRYCEDAAAYLFSSDATDTTEPPLLPWLRSKGGVVDVRQVANRREYGRRPGATDRALADLKRYEDAGLLKVRPKSGGKGLGEVILNGGGSRSGSGGPDNGASASASTSANIAGEAGDPGDDGWWPSTPDDLEH